MVSDGAAYGIATGVYVALSLAFMGFSLLYPKLAGKWCAPNQEEFRTYGDQV